MTETGDSVVRSEDRVSVEVEKSWSWFPSESRRRRNWIPLPSFRLGITSQPWKVCVWLVSSVVSESSDFVAAGIWTIVKFVRERERYICLKDSEYRTKINFWEYNGLA